MVERAFDKEERLKDRGNMIRSWKWCPEMRSGQRWQRGRWTRGDGDEWMQRLGRARKIDLKRMFNDAKRCWNDKDTKGTFCEIKWGGDEVKYNDKVVDRERGDQSGRSWCRSKGTKEDYSWWKYRATKINGSWDIAWSLSNCPKTTKTLISPEPLNVIGRLRARFKAMIKEIKRWNRHDDVRRNDWERAFAKAAVLGEWWWTDMVTEETWELAWKCFREIEDDEGQAENELKEGEICRKAQMW